MTTNTKEYGREWYRRNKDKRLKLNKEYKTRQVEKFKILKESLVCYDCGDDRAPVLDFHHLDPTTKEISVSKAAYRGWSVGRLQQEIEKCVVLCANCHRMRHYNAPLAQSGQSRCLVNIRSTVRIR